MGGTNSKVVPTPVMVSFPKTPLHSTQSICEYKKQINNLMTAAEIAMKVAKIASALTGPLKSAINVLLELIPIADKLHENLVQLEFNIYSTVVKAKIQVLNSCVCILNDDMTSHNQKVAEIVHAIHAFEEIYVYFIEGTAMYNYYPYSSALFVGICGTFAVICKIAENFEGYNNPNHTALKTRYRKLLSDYKYRCIKERIRSASVFCMPSTAGYGSGGARHYVSEQLKGFPTYFSDEDFKYKGLLSRAPVGEEPMVFQKGFNLEAHLIICDYWEIRPYTYQDDCRTEFTENKYDLIDGELLKYRKQVVNEMETFFDIHF